MTTVPSNSTPPTTPFNRDEMNGFEQEDIEAGRFIGRVLCFFFAYTVVVTILAAWWTYLS